jgi:hypothetical protein
MSVEAAKAGVQLVQQAGVLGTGIPPGSALIAFIQLILGGGFAAALFTAWPKIKEAAVGRANFLDESRQEDMAALRAEVAAGKAEAKADIASVKAEAREANDRAQRADERARDAENRLQAAVVVIRMLSAKFKSQWPDDPLLQDMSDLIDLATSTSMGLDRGLARVVAKTVEGK